MNRIKYDDFQGQLRKYMPSDNNGILIPLDKKHKNSLMNVKVYHDYYGPGIIYALERDIISVIYKTGEKKNYIYPQAFINKNLFFYVDDNNELAYSRFPEDYKVQWSKKIETHSRTINFNIYTKRTNELSYSELISALQYEWCDIKIRENLKYYIEFKKEAAKLKHKKESGKYVSSSEIQKINIDIQNIEEQTNIFQFLLQERKSIHDKVLEALCDSQNSLCDNYYAARNVLRLCVCETQEDLQYVICNTTELDYILDDLFERVQANRLKKKPEQYVEGDWGGLKSRGIYTYKDESGVRHKMYEQIEQLLNSIFCIQQENQYTRAIKTIFDKKTIRDFIALYVAPHVKSDNYYRKRGIEITREITQKVFKADAYTFLSESALYICGALGGCSELQVALNEKEIITVKNAFQNTVAQFNERKEKTFTDVIYVYFRLSNSCVKYHHPIETLTLESNDMNSNRTTFMNVFHCKLCDKYFINSDLLEEYASNNILPAFHYHFVNDVKLKLRDFSQIRLYGYNAAADMGETERQDILRWIIESKLMTKEEIIRDLQFKISYNGKKAGNDVARKKWQNDLVFVSTYTNNNKLDVEGTIKREVKN